MRPPYRRTRDVMDSQSGQRYATWHHISREGLRHLISLPLSLFHSLPLAVSACADALGYRIARDCSQFRDLTLFRCIPYTSIIPSNDTVMKMCRSMALYRLQLSNRHSAENIKAQEVCLDGVYKLAVPLHFFHFSSVFTMLTLRIDKNTICANDLMNVGL